MSASMLAVIGAAIVVWCALSRRATRSDITAPMAFVLLGLVLGGPHLLDVELDTEAVKLIAEVTLVLILFNDAARVDLGSLRHDKGLPIRLLGIGLPLTLLAGVAVGWLLIPGAGAWGLVLLAACLAPTDAGLGAGIVNDTRLPSRIRRVLNVESGLNDGLIAPVVTLAIAVLAEEASGTQDFLAHAVREIGVGALVGIAVGVAGGWILTVGLRRGWSEKGTTAGAAVALSLTAYAAALSTNGNGFVAAFVAGLAFGPFCRAFERTTLEQGEELGRLTSAVVWFIFGAAMLRPALSDLSWQVAAYAVLSLTLVRMVPVALALIGEKLDARTVAFIGWFGPRGMASIVFALLAADDLGAGVEPLLTFVSVAVALSVLAHGITASPFIRLYGAHVATVPDDHPVLRPVPVPKARRSLGHVGPASHGLGPPESDIEKT